MPEADPRERKNRSVCVNGMWFFVSPDTPDPLPQEVYDDLYEESLKQKDQWDKVDRAIAGAHKAMNSPARRDDDGGLPGGDNALAGMLPGDSPIEVENIEADAPDPRGENPTTRSAWRP